ARNAGQRIVAEVAIADEAEIVPGPDLRQLQRVARIRRENIAQEFGARGKFDALVQGALRVEGRELWRNLGDDGVKQAA
ncbi:MAG: hypothetical protein ACXW3R_16450, partial [Rhodoplanes sp.]